MVFNRRIEPEVLVKFIKELAAAIDGGDNIQATRIIMLAASTESQREILNLMAEVFCKPFAFVDDVGWPGVDREVFLSLADENEILWRNRILVGEKVARALNKAAGF